MEVVLSEGPFKPLSSLGRTVFGWDAYYNVKEKRVFYVWANFDTSYIAAVVTLENDERIPPPQKYDEFMENVKILCEARWGGG